MEEEKGEESSENDGRRRRNCGYRYMMPSYAVDEEADPTTSYIVVADALLQNSSAHGLPTLYLARGLTPSIGLSSMIHNINNIYLFIMKIVPISTNDK